MRKKLLIIPVIFSLLLTTGCDVFKGPDKDTEKALRPVTLNYWRVWDGPDDFAEAIEKYNQLHPNVTIKYRKLRFEEYEQALIEAFAVDKGPDIFSIHNTWMNKYHSKGLISPLPAQTTMAYPILKGSIKKEIIQELRTTKSITLKQVKNDFVDVVYDDVVLKDLDEKTDTQIERIYGLPLFIDTLAMFYNNDLLNNAGITKPPEYWNAEFQLDIKKLTKQNNKGEIIQSGVALGGSKNIERATDILAVLMMQNGTEMMTNNGQVKFHIKPESIIDKNYNPGLDALRFYSDFSNPAKEVYSWNKDMENSLDLFSQNKLAIMFGYSYMIPTIKANAPKLNYSISKLPQIEGNPRSINFANYWVETVSSKILTNPENLKIGKDYTSQKLDSAWDFVQFISKKEQVETYLKKTKKPTALRSLVDGQLDDQDIGVFAEQVLTSKSWYKGNDANAAELIINEMIDKVAAENEKLDDLIVNAARKVQQTVFK
jgi:ABC-type glycerol-3-phosphate transport system substrate-binding protein